MLKVPVRPITHHVTLKSLSHLYELIINVRSFTDLWRANCLGGSSNWIPGYTVYFKQWSECLTAPHMHTLYEHRLLITVCTCTQENRWLGGIRLKREIRDCVDGACTTITWWLYNRHYTTGSLDRIFEPWHILNMLMILLLQFDTAFVHLTASALVRQRLFWTLR